MVRMAWRFWWALFSLVVTLLVGGCGGNDGGGGGTVKLAVSPSDITLAPNTEVVFSALVSPSEEVVWTVSSTGGGTVSSSGRYRSPSAVGDYKVRVALRSDASRFAEATVRVTDGAYVLMTPLVTQVPGGLTQNFTGTVVNGSGEIRYEVVEPEGGTITEEGLYTAPDTPGTYHVRSFLVGRPNSGSTAVVTVTDPIAVRITRTPPNGIVGAEMAFEFEAVIDNMVDGDSLEWSTTGSDIDEDSGYFTGNEYPGTFTVTAASRLYPNRRATFEVTVKENPLVRMTIRDKGDIVFRLNSEKALATSTNFGNLVLQEYYDGIVFHRYEENFVIQGGDPLTKTLPLDDPSIGTGGPGYQIKFEETGLLHLKYAIAMARGSDKDSAGSQFYFCLRDLPELDGEYAVFGELVSGQAIVDALRRGDVIEKAVLE
jgi:cyclophilin family peptidyl-prolyl cis-trans isomerase